MKLDNQNLEWELCEAYFSILEMSMTSEISLDRLCVEAKTSREEVEKIIPNNPIDLYHLSLLSCTNIMQWFFYLYR